MAMETAVILAGAVAKGAFEAGALEVLSSHAEALHITRVVGASAGALNASVFAVGLRARAELRAAANLVELWADSATWHNVVDVNLRDILALTGVGTPDRVLDLMMKAVAGLHSDTPREVSLSLVLTSLAGSRGQIGGDFATTFEHPAHFHAADLDTPEQRERVFKTALGSAAFPVLFAPVDVPNVGPCIDGGAVNNGPVRLALTGKSRIDRIIVVTPEPLISKPPEPLSGFNLLGHVAEILINERLYRDLHDAEAVNEDLRKLDRLESEGVSAEVIARVKHTLRWRPLKIVQIRPEKELHGNPFEAFKKRGLREDYIKAGRDAAAAKLSVLTES